MELLAARSASCLPHDVLYGHTVISSLHVYSYFHQTSQPHPGEDDHILSLDCPKGTIGNSSIRPFARSNKDTRRTNTFNTMPYPQCCVLACARKGRFCSTERVSPYYRQKLASWFAVSITYLIYHPWGPKNTSLLDRYSMV